MQLVSNWYHVGKLNFALIQTLTSSLHENIKVRRLRNSNKLQSNKCKNEITVYLGRSPHR